MKKTIITLAIITMSTITLASCCSNDYAEDYHNEITRIAKTQEATKVELATRVLRRALADGFLDENGKRRFRELIATSAPLERYIALIEECQREESFLDVVGSTDEWEAYVTNVLER